MAEDKPVDARVAALATHANERDTLEFSEKILHGKIAFQKGEIVRFTDPAAAAYFDVAFNGTEFTDKVPTRTITDEEINFDPDDPSGNETIDPATVIIGRTGVTDRTAVHEAAAGNVDAGNGDTTLDVHDVDSRSEG